MSSDTSRRETLWGEVWGKEGGEVTGALWGLPCVILYYLDVLWASTPGGENWKALFEDATVYFACNIGYL